MQTHKASKLGLTTDLLSSAVLEVIDRLLAAGYDAYIVGGSVRDSLLGMRPKDFDAVTNATPEQIKKVFGRQCRIIGRRFELAHVYCGRDLIEVATFRAPGKVSANESGMILRDNNWGTIRQDYSRRDFTINALYYQPRTDKILDFCRGIDDLKLRTLRFLGDPQQRFVEDPVRILRVLRFAAKLGFGIDPDVLAELRQPQSIALLGQVSPHRLFDETNKMFTSGALLALLELLLEHRVWQQLFPFTAPDISTLLKLAAENTDRRLRSGKSINPAFFWAVLLWNNFCTHLRTVLDEGLPYVEAVEHAGRQTLQEVQKHIAIPRFAEGFVREIWALQARLIQPKPRQIPALALHPRFRAAYDFLVLREQAGDLTTGKMGEWWTDYQQLSNDSRELAIADLNRQQQRRRKQQGSAALPVPEPLKTAPVPVPDLEDDLDDSWTQPAARQPASRRPIRRVRRPRDLSSVFMGPYV